MKRASAPEIASNQLTLDFEPGLHERYRSLRECVATGVYQRGLGRIAIDLDLAPSNLSVQLSEDPTRRFSVESLETYIAKTGDTQPIYYLISRFLQPKQDETAAAKDQLMAMFSQLAPAMKKAGFI